MPDLLLGTRNLHKIREITAILAGLPLTLHDLREFPRAPEVEETGATFRANAELKARTWAAVTGLPTLADDSGLEVDALGGRPGVTSARYAGPGADDGANNRKLLEEMAGVPAGRRTARYRCVIVVAAPAGLLACAEGTCEGRMAESPRGDGGFGYDPLFLIAPVFTRTMAELPAEEKNRISHRARALEAIRGELAAAGNG
ncbi:MAG: XTP/dITP diphosphatase [Planctomycetes bacterium]|nr:XTP/dITP diphosphatase [Planctomycetota bacterium]